MRLRDAGRFTAAGFAFHCGWTVRRVELDARGYDAFGWWWRTGLPLYHCTDGADSLTLRATSLVAAVRALAAEGMPPRTQGKLNWSALKSS